MPDRPPGLHEAPASFAQHRAPDYGREPLAAAPDQRFRGYADAGSDWLWETDAQLRFTYLTTQFTVLTGIPVEQVIGRSRSELIGESGLGGATLQRHLADLEARRPFRDFCYRIVNRATGAGRHVRVSGKPVFD